MIDTMGRSCRRARDTRRCAPEDVNVIVDLNDMIDGILPAKGLGAVASSLLPDCDGFGQQCG